MSEITGQPNLTQFAEAVVDAASEQIRVAIPGTFVSVASDMRSGAVQPSIARQNASADPAIPDVPILFPGGSGASVTWPILAGDPCLIVFCDRSTEEWISAGGSSSVEPTDDRTHDISDAIAIPMGIGGATNDGTVRVNVGIGGKVAIGNGTAELVSLASQLCDAFIANSAFIGTGVAPGSPVPANPAIITLLTTIKASLDSIKGTL